MKKIIITYGLIAGAIVSVMMLISMPLHQNGMLDMESGMLVGYTTMIIALSMVFFGVKNYRDHHREGYITFGEAFKIGILISVLASVLYAFTWEIYYHFKGDEFNAWYAKCQIDDLTKNGASPAEITAKKTEIEDFTTLYENFFPRFGFTLLEIFPVGLVVTLITAAFLRKRKASS